MIQWKEYNYVTDLMAVTYFLCSQKVEFVYDISILCLNGMFFCRGSCDLMILVNLLFFTSSSNFTCSIHNLMTVYSVQELW